MEGRWGPWVKTSKELGLVGPKSQNDKKAYNKYIKAGFQKLNISKTPIDLKLHDIATF